MAGGIFGGGSSGIGTVFTLQAILSLNADGFRAGLQSAGNEADSQGQLISGSLSAMGAVAIAALQEISDFMNEVIASGSQFETAFAQLQTIADTSAVGVDELSQGVRALSSELGVSASEIAITAYSAISAGADTADALDEVRVAGRLATAGFTDTNSALQILRGTMNAYGESAGTIEEISDQLIQTQNLGVTTVAELANNMGRAVATGSAYGVSMQNLESAYISLTRQNINTAMATTYLSGMMTELGSAGTTVSDILIEQTGQSFGQLMGSGYSLADVLGVLMESVDNDSEAFANLWGNARAGMAASAIVSQGLQTFNDNLVTLGNSAGTTDEAYSIMADTFQHRSDVLNTSIDNLKISVFEAFEPLLTKIVETIQNFFDNTDIESLAGTIQNIVTAVSTFAAVILTAVAVVKAITIAQTAFNLVMNANPIMLIVTLIAMLISALVTLWTTNEDFRNAVINIFNGIRDFFMTIWNWIKEHIIEPVKEAFWAVVDWMQEHVIRPQQEALRAFVQFFQTYIVQPIQEKIEIVKQVFWAVVGWMQEHVIRPQQEAMRAVIQFFQDRVVRPIQERIEVIKNVFWTVVGWMQEHVIRPQQEAMRAVIQFFQDRVIRPIQEKIEMIKNAFWTVVGFVQDRVIRPQREAMQAFVQFFRERIIQPLQERTEMIKNTFWAAVDFVKTRVIQPIKDAFESFKQFFFGIVQRIISGFQEWQNIGNNIINGIREGMQRAMSGLIDSVRNIGNTISSTFRNLLGISSPSRVMRDQVGKWIPLGIADGINEYASAAYDAVGEMVDGLSDEANVDIDGIPGFDSDFVSDMVMEVDSDRNGFAESINNRIDQNFANLLGMLQYYFPQLANQQIVLNDGTIAGAVNRSLGLGY